MLFNKEIARNISAVFILLSGSLYASDIRWTYQAQGFTGDTIGFYRNNVLVCGADGTFSVLNVDDGRELQTKKFDTYFSARPFEYGGNIYLCGGNGQFFCTDFGLMKTIYSENLSGNIMMTPVVDGNICFTGNAQGFFYAINLDERKIIRKTFIDGLHKFSPVIFGEKIFLISKNGIVYCLNKESLKLIWNIELKVPSDGSLVLSASNLIVKCARKIFCLKPEDGTVIWSRELELIESITPLSSGDSLYIATTDKKLFRLAAKTGKMVKEFELEANPVSSLFEYDNALYFADENGYLSSLWLTNSKFYRYAEIGTTIGFEPRLYNDLIFAGNSSGQLYAFTPSLLMHKNLLKEKEWLKVKKGKATIVVMSSDIFIYESGKRVFHWNSYKRRYLELLDHRAIDLNSDSKKDHVFLFNLDDGLKYSEIVVLLNLGKSYKVITYNNIGAKSIDEIVRDLNGDGIYELLLRREIGDVLDVDINKRVLWTDIYRYQDRQYVWASIDFPDYYERRVIPVYEKKRKMKLSFSEEWMPSLFKIYCNYVIDMAWRMITVQRQTKALNFKAGKNYRQKLSLWYYRFGIESMQRRWDNLALFIFSVEIKLNPDYIGPYYQMGRIYENYGLNDYATGAYSKTPELFFCQDRYPRKMTEEEDWVNDEPVNSDMQIALAGSLMASFDFSSATNIYTGLLKSRQSKTAYYNLAKCYQKFPDRIRDAIECWKMYIKLNGSNMDKVTGEDLSAHIKNLEQVLSE